MEGLSREKETEKSEKKSWHRSMGWILPFIEPFLSLIESIAHVPRLCNGNDDGCCVELKLRVTDDCLKRRSGSV